MGVPRGIGRVCIRGICPGNTGDTELVEVKQVKGYSGVIAVSVAVLRYRTVTALSILAV